MSQTQRKRSALSSVAWPGFESKIGAETVLGRTGWTDSSRATSSKGTAAAAAACMYISEKKQRKKADPLYRYIISSSDGDGEHMLVAGGITCRQ